MDNEYFSLIKNHTWDLVNLPPTGQPINKWIFTVKYKFDGSVKRFKARLVAKGYSQLPGVDYIDTFSPILKITSIRVLLALCALHDWEIHQLDVKTPFLYGDLTEVIFMPQPEGYVQQGSEYKVC